MFTVNELALETAAPPHVVRYYARIGLLKPKAHKQNGYRLFGSLDSQRLRFIRLAKNLGFTLNEIKQLTEPGGAMMGMRGQFVVVAWVVNYTTLDWSNRNV